MLYEIIRKKRELYYAAKIIEAVVIVALTKIAKVGGRIFPFFYLLVNCLLRCILIRY